MTGASSRHDDWYWLRKWGTLRSVLLASSALVPLGTVTAARHPQGPNVVGGAASVSGVGTSSVTVNQSTNRAIINWNSFNIGAGETPRFVQPNSSSVALNRVTGKLGRRSSTVRCRRTAACSWSILTAS